MSEYCRQCAAGEGNPPDAKAEPGQILEILCEGCGWTVVDDEGTCIGYCGDPSHPILAKFVI